MSTLPLEDYGLIGDMRTAALVGSHGSIDWWCVPHFDSPSVFAALLDDERGGRFLIEPVTPRERSKQLYLPDTNVLVTSFMGEGGLLIVTDFMPVPPEARVTTSRPQGTGGPPTRLMRRVAAVGGPVAVRVVCQPAFDYAREEHELHVEGTHATFRTERLTLHLHGTRPLSAGANGAATAEFTLQDGEDATFTLSADETDVLPEFRHLERDTLRFWRGWLRQCRYDGLWREQVRRSALVLKMLTFAPTGAIVAAPTTSLPERIGGPRNWDYRYMWPRDAAFTVYALLRLGFTAEAKAFNDFVEARSHEGAAGVVRPIYRIDGTNDLEEHTLDHLSGYRDSRPVRIGNGAAHQVQLDVYGELLDAIYLYNKYGEPLSYDEWTEVRRILDHVCDHWADPDDGIWEVRSGQRPHVLSRVMCWVALERGVRIALARGLPAPLDRWREQRDLIYEDVMERGYDEEIGAFTQSYGSPVMDAANLLMPLVKFVGPRDPRWLGTLDRIQRELAVGPLVFRYRLDRGAEDGVAGEEGAFVACSFWLVECLARAGRVEEARTNFEALLTFASPLGLLSEEVSTGGLLLGNMPQALSHLALISAAFELDRTLKGEG